MKNLLTVVFAACLTAVCAAQEISGVRLSLTAPSIVAAQGEVSLRLHIQVTEDCAVPSQMLTGANLTVRTDGEPHKPVLQKGKGGPVQLLKGTQIQRVLTFPAATFMTNPDIGEVVTIAVGWKGLAGVDCSFKIAPNTKNIKLEELDLNKTQVMLVTNYGDIHLEFRHDKAPKHVENFVKLCLQGFYDDTKFHRVIKNFMLQGGCPFTRHEKLREKWGSGGAGYNLKLETSDLRHLRGTISMARGDGNDTASSGFFLVHKDSAHLDGLYSAFGNVVAGMDTLDRIAHVRLAGPTMSAPVEPVILQAAVVLPKKK
ncbi:MAG: peptidyl-prolyl cis-trans isomerase B (cyclophilin B) [Planctomycetota bacterium]|jgi:peptidyl-prolyl cis-trans isomerase B (cyclophilin B)